MAAEEIGSLLVLNGTLAGKGRSRYGIRHDEHSGERDSIE